MARNLQMSDRSNFTIYLFSYTSGDLAVTATCLCLEKGWTDQCPKVETPSGPKNSVLDGATDTHSTISYSISKTWTQLHSNRTSNLYCRLCIYGMNDQLITSDAKQHLNQTGCNIFIKLCCCLTSSKENWDWSSLLKSPVISYLFFVFCTN